MRHHISDGVVLPFDVGNGVVILRKKLLPPALPSREITLQVKIFKCVAVHVDIDVCTQEVYPPFAERTDDRKKFLLMSRVLSLLHVHLL